jgi:hypothetical protein
MAMLRALGKRGGLGGGLPTDDAASRGFPGGEGGVGFPPISGPVADAASDEAGGFDPGGVEVAAAPASRRGAPPAGLPPLNPARGGETPRDRATPSRPPFPSPGAGSVLSSQMPGGPGPKGPLGPVNFEPLRGGQRGLFGRNRGLQGGGLGVMSPAAGAENEPIDGILQQLMSILGRG